MKMKPLKFKLWEESRNMDIKLPAAAFYTMLQPVWLSILPVKAAIVESLQKRI